MPRRGRWRRPRARARCRRGARCARCAPAYKQAPGVRFVPWRWYARLVDTLVVLLAVALAGVLAVALRWQIAIRRRAEAEIRRMTREMAPRSDVSEALASREALLTG